jgi:hypothetical protein
VLLRGATLLLRGATRAQAVDAERPVRVSPRHQSSHGCVCIVICACPCASAAPSTEATELTELTMQRSGMRHRCSGRFRRDSASSQIMNRTVPY